MTFAPEMNKRTSTPYSYSLDQPKRHNPSQRTRASCHQISSVHHRQVDVLLGSKSQPSSPRRDSARYSPSAKKGRDYFAAGYSGYFGRRKCDRRYGGVRHERLRLAVLVARAPAGKDRATYPRPTRQESRRAKGKSSHICCRLRRSLHPRMFPVRRGQSRCSPQYGHRQIHCLLCPSSE